EGRAGRAPRLRDELARCARREVLLEQVAGMPTEVDYGSEFRCRTLLVDKGTVAVAIRQSRETADTLAAFREAKAKGTLPVANCNVKGRCSPARPRARSTHPGPEIGVPLHQGFHRPDGGPSSPRPLIRCRTTATAGIPLRS